MITPAPHIAAMSPYALADLRAPQGKQLVSLSQNESLRPPCPAAVSAAAKAMQAAHLYPDPDWQDLRLALSEVHGIAVEGILCGNGSMELIACLTQAFCDENSAVLAPVHAYPFFKTATHLARARYDTAPEVAGRVCVDHLLAAVQPDTRIVFVANPGNPTGTRLANTELRRLRDGLRGDILLVIDEAYGEFADHMDGPVFDLVARGDTVILRTLSKAYGLAGLRVGWGLFPAAVATQVRKVMNPNTISVPGQAAAVAAVMDQPYMRETCALTAHLRDTQIERLRAVGFDVPESFTNFALIRLATPDTAQSADRALRAEGVFLRAQGGAGLPDCLRMTIGAAEDLTLAADVLQDWAQRNGS